MNTLSQHYGVILADPPWTFATYSRKGKGRSAEAHYDCMSLVDIKALPVGDWAAPDCTLFLWATDPSLPQALEVIAAWGFVYKTVGFTWVKTTKDGAGFPIGCGYWARANPEQCLLATRGRTQRLSRAVPQLVRTGPPTVGDDELLVMLIAACGTPIRTNYLSRPRTLGGPKGIATPGPGAPGREGEVTAKITRRNPHLLARGSPLISGLAPRPIVDVTTASAPRRIKSYEE